MRNFDMIIGYSAEKKEPRHIADTLKNRETKESPSLNAAFLEKVAAADIQKIKGECKIVPVAL